MTVRKKGLAVVWVRQDLRIEDHMALQKACEYEHVLPLYIDEPQSAWPMGGASRWWLHHSLLAYRESLRQKGSDLMIQSGNLVKVFQEVCAQVDVAAVFWNRNYNPICKFAVQNLVKFLEERSISWEACHGGLLCEPKKLLKADGTPYLVYTPFWKNFVKVYRPQKFQTVQIPNCPDVSRQGLEIDDLQYLPRIPWDAGFHMWKPGEQHAYHRLQSFLGDGVGDYRDQRDYPGVEGTSFLSPSLHFGEIHPQRILAEVIRKHGPLHKLQDESVIQFCKEVVWREFAYHLLYHFEDLPQTPLKENFLKFPWNEESSYYDAWTKGQTGYPIVDAGMRQLWQTGWMHNRIRMVVASFLVKHLQVHWRKGAEWFWDTLLDADLASNSMGWQWVAGCGPDAAPFFRIFNPITQGEKFDKDGTYVKTWCPELRNMPVKWIHKPWEAPRDVLEASGVSLGRTYPYPLVDHKTAREKALAAYKSLS